MIYHAIERCWTLLARSNSSSAYFWLDIQFPSSLDIGWVYDDLTKIVWDAWYVDTFSFVDLYAVQSFAAPYNWYSDGSNNIITALELCQSK